MSKQKDNKANSNKIIIVHTVPKMTDAERETAKRRISGDLYEIFAHIAEELKIESENSQN